MDRRQFLERVAAWSAGVGLATPLFDIPSVLAADKKPTEEPLLSVGEGKDYEALVARVLKPIGGMAAFVRKDDRVVVKPNIGWAQTPDKAANTHPEVVKAVVRQCLDAGAKRVLVFDRPCNEERSCYNESGIKAAVDSLADSRALCVYQDKDRFVPVDIANGKSIQKFSFYQDALESDCDCYINVPVAKHHKISTLTLGLKNVMGVIGGNQGEIHKVNIHQRIADLNLVVRPKLTIIDATRILLHNGPTGGKIEDVKVLDTLVGSADTVAADAYATRFFDKKPADILSIVAAAKLGLGQIDLSKVKVVQA